ncbi:hypothetical protein ABS71_09215 [bacterium SCN 62-11]|nr:type II secretion system protein [Candidatus Eremiobacteraeota bacterium]ODT69125.1 MAG: hypothetical protein ABS71_09215 [bacterium SCN 62-11]
MKRRRGFTIVEMMVSLTLMALLLGVVAVNFHGPRGRADSKGAAVVLASALRQARQQALSEGRTVAVAFASENGARAHSSGFYQLVGETKPQLASRTSFTREYGGVSVFCGQYDGLTWSTSYPSSLNTNGFDLGAWQAPYPQDHMVAFLPNGLAVSDLPLGGGAYRLVVAKSFSYSGSPATLSAAEEPRTVSIRPSGEVLEDAAVPGSTSVAYQVGGFRDGAALPAITSAANRNPELVTPYLKLNPDVNADMLAAVAPAGSTATVPPNGMLTFTVYATDPDGDQLWCKWSGPGTFSSQEGARMVWNETQKRWVGEWSWKVPQGARADDTYSLACTVYDNHGGVTSPVDVGLSMPKPAIISGQSLLCAMLDGAYRWNWDGTGAQRIVRREDVLNKAISKARWSPDFSSVAIVAENDVYLCTPEGQNLQLLYSYPDPVDALCWDRDGLKLYAITKDRLHSLIPDPSVPGRDAALTGNLGLDRPSSLSMHPSSKLLLTSDYSSAQLMTIWLPDPLANNNPVQFSRVADSLGDQIHNPIFDKDGTTLYFRCREPEESGLCSMKAPAVINPNTRSFTFPGTETYILNSEGSGSGYTISPDGLYIAGGLPGDRVAICPVNGTSLADTIDVTAVPAQENRRVVDIDWGYY